MTASPPADPTESSVCPRHPDRASYVRCQRCGRPTCPECQRPAAVGIQCVDCVREQAATMPRTRTIFGGTGSGNRPWVTYTIIAICVAVWIGEWVTPRVFQEVAFSGILGEREPWRFLTAAFAHLPENFLHIGFNMYALWVLGPYLEAVFGWLRFLVLYLVAAFGGTVMYLALLPRPAVKGAFTVADTDWLTGMVGASGAVFGLFGAVVVVNRLRGVEVTQMYVVIGINAVLGFVVPGIAWQAHLGGLIVGVVMALILTRLGRAKNAAVPWVAMAAVVVVLIAAAAIKYATI